jgi:ABC-2 type transport system permease protein
MENPAPKTGPPPANPRSSILDPRSSILFVRTMLARAYPRVIGLWREPTWMLQETLMPLLSVFAFVYVYRMMNAPEQYTGFVILGGVMTAFWLNVLWAMGAQLYWERDSGNLEPFIIAPCSLMAILAGMALGGMVMTSVRAAAVLLAGAVLFGVSFDPGSWWALVGIFLLTLAALYGLGMVFASAFLMWGREAWHIANLLQEPVYLLSGLNYPIRMLGALAYLAGVLPLAIGMDALRQVLYGDAANGLLDPEWEIGLLVLMSVVFIDLARRCLARLERRAREEGRLTVKWQ